VSAVINSVPSAWAKGMGYAGLTPFLALALAVWISDSAHRAPIGLGMLGYGVTITSFLGAIHWGLVMRDMPKHSLALLGWGVVPSLVAWIALLAGPVPGLFVIAGLLWACFAVDCLVYPRFQAQGWLPMRLVLTLIASASCICGALGMLR
jgi:Protein of unknown function (DUF3429)